MCHNVHHPKTHSVVLFNSRVGIFTLRNGNGRHVESTPLLLLVRSPLYICHSPPSSCQRPTRTNFNHGIHELAAFTITIAVAVVVVVVSAVVSTAAAAAAASFAS